MFKLKDNWTVSLFAGGACHWHIIHTSNPDHIFCSYAFSQADPRHEKYEEYMAGVKAAAQCVVDQLNKAETAGEDAKRWQALMASGRMHFMGCAGISWNNTGTPHLNADRTHVHFGMEFWDKFRDDYKAEDNADHQLCKKVLILYTDLMIKEAKPGT